MNHWDDLRVFLAAARAGSFVQASARLNMDASTIGRRIARLESNLKQTLVVRSPRGLKLTAAGSRLFDAAVKVEAAMEISENVNTPGMLHGIVRISVYEGIGTIIIAPALPQFVAMHPGLTIELVANAGFLSPATREVDIALELSPAHSPRLSSERLIDARFGLFTSEQYLASCPPIRSVDDLRKQQLVGYIDDLLHPPELRYMDDIGTEITPTFTSTSVRAQYEIIKAGGGIGILPCFIALGAGPGLRWLLRDEIKFYRTIWISAHKEVSGTARVKTVHRWLRQLAEDNRHIFCPN